MRRIYARVEIASALAALLEAGLSERTLRIVALALSLSWLEVLEVRGRVIEISSENAETGRRLCHPRK